jgi:hypothetical protein
MARPAIIIGLGGTGQWALTLIKKNLTESYQKVPDNIKLLSFDTMSETSVKAAGSRATDEDQVQVGGISLEKGNEFISLTGNVRIYGDEISKGLHPHISSWFDANYYLSMANPALWDLGAGAAQVRQFGRLAFFAKAQDVIASNVNRAIEDVRKLLSDKDQIQLIVISSFAGGTGAGMFIDMGLLCRHLIENGINNAIFTRGFFVLPSVFGASAMGQSASQQHMLARSFAAWRELDRFMSIGSGYGLGNATYMKNVPSLDFEINTRPYDVCYLVDSHRDSHSLDTVDPREGVYPSISDFVSFLLDDNAGREYHESISVNAAGGFQYLTNEAKYSVFGTYKVKSPVYYVQENYCINALNKLLEEWLVPAKNKKNEIVGLVSIMNSEVGEGISGKDEALKFFNRQAEFIPNAGDGKSQSVANTQFLPRVADVYSRRGQDKTDMINRDADGGFSQSEEGQTEVATYIGVMSQLAIQDQNIQGAIDREIYATESIFIPVPTSKVFGDPTDEAIERLEAQIPQFFKEHFGGEQGGYTASGRYGQMLNQCREFHVERSKELIHQFSSNVLNGINNDPKIAKRGKLGFLQNALEGMVEYLDYFIGYLDKVRDERDQRGLINIARQEEDEKKATMFAFAGKRILGMEAKKAHETQEQYLQAVDFRLTVIKDDMLIGAMRRTTEEIKDVVLQALTEVSKWTKLFIGDRNSDDPNLYAEIQDRMDKVGATYNADKSIKTIQTTLGLPDYSEVSNIKDIESNMGRISWKVDLTNKGLEIHLFVSLPEEYEDDNGDIQVREKLHEVQTVGMDPLEDVRKYFYELSSLQYLSFPKQHYVVDELRTNSKYSNPDHLSLTAKDYSNVLFAGRPALDVSKIQKAFYIRCKNDHNSDATRYATQVQKWLTDHVEEMKGQNQGIQLLSSEDPFVCEFIRSYSNVDSTSFLRWHELKEAYLRHIQQMKDREDASRLHIFPAEYHASKYEQMITPLLHKPYRAFHPRVVTMLENPDRLSLFFRCAAYGFFETLEGAQYDGFSFCLPGLDPYVLIPEDQDGRSAEPDYFEKVYSFVLSGKDAITGLFIDWKQVITTVRKHEKQLQENSSLETELDEKLESGLIAAIESEGTDTMKRDRSNNPGSYATEKTWGWHPGQEFLDLADIGRLMIKEVVRNSKTSKFI